MVNKKYEIEYLPTFISQFNNILYYITYELKNKIAADNFYNEVVKQIEIRSEAPEAYEVFKTIKKGKTDIELNEIGIEQAKKLKELIKDYNIDLIISSPLKRARKTAEVINEAVKCNIIFEESLKERGYGIFEGMIRKEINDELINSDILNNYQINKEYKEIETIQSLCNRVWKLLDKLKQEYKDNNILLVTHGGTIRAINGYFNGTNEKGIIDNPGLKNCEIKLYEC